MASSRNLVSTIGAQASPKKGDGTRCPEGLVFPAYVPRGTKLIGNKSFIENLTVQSYKNGYKYLKIYCIIMYMHVHV